MGKLTRRVLDGGLATSLQREGLGRHETIHAWLLEQPDRIRRVHRDFVDAGAQGLLTGTFRTLAPVDERWVELAEKATDLACVAGAGQAWIWGSIGPATCPDWSALDNHTQNQWRKAWSDLAQRIGDRVHGLVLETFIDVPQARAALQAVKSARPDLAVVTCLVPTENARLANGEPVRHALETLWLAGADILGFNCATPLAIQRSVDCVHGVGPLWAKPSAGEHLRDTLVHLSDHCEWVGGCCGVDAADIQRIAPRVHARHV